jgi:hypothetical protein
MGMQDYAEHTLLFVLSPFAYAIVCYRHQSVRGTGPRETTNRQITHSASTQAPNRKIDELLKPLDETTSTQGPDGLNEDIKLKHKFMIEVPRTGDDITCDPGNGHGTLPERVPIIRLSSRLAHLARSP